MKAIKKSKYHARKVCAFGLVFDSEKEFARWQELRLLERDGYISQLQRQVKFELIPAQREPDIIGVRGGRTKGKLIERACSYIADFTYLDENGNFVVEDTKGVRTDDYTIKRKLMLYLKGIRIKET
jgi:hypothetical protein